jgi:hypothetical protein
MVIIRENGRIGQTVPKKMVLKFIPNLKKHSMQEKRGQKTKKPRVEVHSVL